MKRIHCIQAEVWQNRHLSHVFFTNNHYSAHTFEPHFHEHWVIQVVEEGINEGVCERKKYRVSSRDLVLINPGEIHTGASLGGKPLHYLTICPWTPFIQNLLSSLEYAAEMLPNFHSTHIENPNTIQQFYELWAMSRQKGVDQLALESAGLTFFSSLFAQYANCKFPAGVVQEPHKIKAVQDFLRSNYAANISLTELSQVAQLSPAHLIRCFQKETGQTPFAFLRNYRIEQAKHLLLKQFPISDVAQRVGFYDQSHFHAHFKQVTGITPLAFKG